MITTDASAHARRYRLPVSDAVLPVARYQLGFEGVYQPNASVMLMGIDAVSEASPYQPGRLASYRSIVGPEVAMMDAHHFGQVRTQDRRDRGAGFDQVMMVRLIQVTEHHDHGEDVILV